MKIYFLSILFLSLPILIYSQKETDLQVTMDTLQMKLSESIANDTSFASKLVNEANTLAKQKNFLLSYNKADTALNIYISVLGYNTKEVTTCLKRKADCCYNFKDYVKALLFYNSCLQILVKLPGDEQTDVAGIYNNVGLIYSEKGDKNASIESHIKALRIRKIKFGENHAQVASSYNNIGTVYVDLANYSLADSFFNKGLKIRVSLFGESHPAVADSYNNLALVYYKKGQINSSILYHNKALKIRTNSFGENHPSLIYSYNNLGVCYAEIAQYDLSIKYYFKTLNILLKLNGENDNYVAATYNNIGLVFDSKGDYQKGLTYLFKALKIRKNLYNYNHIDIIKSLNNIGNCYTNHNEYNLAHQYLSKSLESKLQLLGESHPDVALSLVGLSNVYLKKGDYEKALDAGLRANKIFITTFGENHPDVAATFSNIGGTLLCKKDISGAIENTQHCIDIIEKNGQNKHPHLASAFKQMGSIYYETNDYEKSLFYFKKSFIIRRSLFGMSHPKTIESLNNILIAFQKYGKLDSALLYSEIIIAAIKLQNNENISIETKSLFQSQNLTFFEQSIDLAIVRSKKERNHFKTAYLYSEMAKATLLQFQIKQNDALSFSGIPDSLTEKEKEYKLNINYLEKQHQELLSSGKEEIDSAVLYLSSLIFDLKRKQENLLSKFEKEYPEYYRLKYDLSTISLEETQLNILKQDECLLEYFVGDSNLYVMVVRKDTFELVNIKKDFALDSIVSELQDGLYGYYGQSLGGQNDELYKKTVSKFKLSSFELYNKLVKPVEHLLTHDVVVIPDGVLGNIPFEALLTEEPKDPGKFNNYPYFIKEHNLSYCYSSTLLKEMRERKHKKQPHKSLVAFAPFYSGSYTMLDSMSQLVFDTIGNNTDTTIFEKVVTRKDFTSLPSSGEEVNYAAKLWKGDYFINKDATEQKFYEVAEDYRIVHLATHGSADYRQGDYSYLAFAEQKDSIENEFLYVRDIYNTNLNADLVVLSACETAQGELQRGEGIISLARAFAYAGAKSILTTLWVVDDAATKDILKVFYVNLRKGQEKDEALRNAKINYLTKSKSRYSHPFFWAGFIPIGDMSKL